MDSAVFQPALDDKRKVTDALRLLAIYLPQFHSIPENDQWWGKSFTEWTNVPKAKPLFRNHYQPHIPADQGFYDLRLPETRIQQAELAREYGIHGFCYYHYWFEESNCWGALFVRFSMVENPISLFACAGPTTPGQEAGKEKPRTC